MRVQWKNVLRLLFVIVGIAFAIHYHREIAALLHDVPALFHAQPGDVVRHHRHVRVQRTQPSQWGAGVLALGMLLIALVALVSLIIKGGNRAENRN